MEGMIAIKLEGRDQTDKFLSNDQIMQDIRVSFETTKSHKIEAMFCKDLYANLIDQK